MHEHLRQYLLTRWILMITRHPWITLGIALPITVACVLYAVFGYTFQPDRNALISTSLDWNKRYIDYISEFSGDDLFVVVKIPKTKAGDIDPEGQRKAQQLVRELGAILAADQEAVIQAHYGFDPLKMGGRSLRLDPSLENFESQINEIVRGKLFLESTSPSDLLNRTQAELEAQARQVTTSTQPSVSEEEGLAQLNDFTSLIAAYGKAATAKDQQEVYKTLVMGEASVEGGQSSGIEDWIYLESDDKELLLIVIQPQMNMESTEDPFVDSIDAIQVHMDALKKKYEGIEFGLTGVPVIEANETRIAAQDSTVASIIAIILISILLFVAFHGWKKPLLAVIALLCGVAWTFGYLFIAVGHLQLLSLVFAIILLGLGIDFGIHLITQYELIRPTKSDGPRGFEQTIKQTVRTVGPGIVTGAVTTAAAFLATGFSLFTGMAEMGQIAGGGVLLCLLAMFTVFPACLRIFFSKSKHVKALDERKVNLYKADAISIFSRYPALAFVVIAVLIGLLTVGWNWVRYESDLTKLLPQEGVESVEWQRELLDHSTVSIWYGISVLDRDNKAEIKERIEAFRALPSVSTVTGMGYLYPPDDKEKMDAIHKARAMIGNSNLNLDPREMSDNPQALINAMKQIRLKLGLAVLDPRVRGDEKVKAGLDQLMVKLNAAIQGWEALSVEQAQQQIGKLGGALEELRIQMIAALDTSALTITDLPEILQHRVVGGHQQEKVMVQISPKHDVYEPAERERFMAEMKTVDPEVTGTVAQIYYSNDLILSEYFKVAGYAIIVVFILIFLDFQAEIEKTAGRNAVLRFINRQSRAVLDALLCLTPVAVAFGLTMGLMGWLAHLVDGETAAFSLNLANIIVLPLLFGIGVDAGVHIIHRYRQAPDEHPRGLGGGTGKGIMLTSMTTMIGFATMMTASHRGVVSLGFLLASGIFFTFVCCMVLMPALLVIRRRIDVWIGERV